MLILGFGLLHIQLCHPSAAERLWETGSLIQAPKRQRIKMSLYISHIGV